jgi:uncharacterized protein (DUF849 family)
MREPKVIIEAAINGVTSKARNPHAPLSPDEIAKDALECLEHGAAIVHNHTDRPADPPEALAQRQLEGWRPVLATRPDAILYPTVGLGGTGEERFGHVPRLAEAGCLRMSVVDPGSVNLGATGKDGIPGGGFDFVYANDYATIRHAVDLCARLRLGPSIAIFEPGFLRTALAYHRAGRLPAGAFVKLYFGGEFDYLAGAPGGASFGLPPTARALDAYLELLAGSGLAWAVAVIGGDVVECGLARLALERGGHLRVGLEDYAGPRTPRNAELVDEAVAAARAVGREVATCIEAAELLELPRASAQGR